MLKTSEQINEISTALAAAQGKMENASKGSVNPAFKSKYADLATILNEVRPILAEHQLAITQHPAYAEGLVYVTTLLSHASGQWMQSCISCRIDAKDNAQALGSAITYLRRYSMAALCSISQEDDDGNKASGKGEKEKAPELNPKILKELELAFSIEGLNEIWQGIDVALRAQYRDHFTKAKERITNA